MQTICQQTSSIDAQITILLAIASPAAIELIYKHYGIALLLYCRRIKTKDTDIAEDILQEAFVNIWKNARQYDPQKERLFSWLVTMVKSTVGRC